eukprot:15457020-Alexandrium_andersonii.AAC.1
MIIITIIITIVIIITLAILVQAGLAQAVLAPSLQLGLRAPLKVLFAVRPLGRCGPSQPCPWLVRPLRNLQ